MGAGRWASFWVWWGFKQASIYLGLGVALIDQTRSRPGPSPAERQALLVLPVGVIRRKLLWLLEEQQEPWADMSAAARAAAFSCFDHGLVKLEDVTRSSRVNRERHHQLRLA